MKTKILLFILTLSVVASPVLGKVGGYFSSSYMKTQEEGLFPKGTFGDIWAGLLLFGDLTTNVHYFSEVSVREESELTVEQAWLGLRASRTFNFKLGLYPVPFGKYNEHNRPHRTLLVNPPLNVDHIYPMRWRDVGVMVEGEFSNIFYSLYIGNGLAEGEDLRAGQQFKDNNKDKGKGGRAGFFLSQGLELGYSLYTGKYDDEDERNLTLQCADLTWDMEGILILSEYSWANIKNPEGFSAGEAKGYFIQASFTMKNLQPVMSYQKIKYTDEFHGRGFSGVLGAGEGISVEKTRWALGVIYTPFQNVFFKLEYDINREKETDWKDNGFVVQVAVSF